MIDLSTEQLLTLSKAARHYPGGGKHVSALHRYRQDRDTPLDCVLSGGIWMTSIPAMHRHVHALTAAATRRHNTPPVNTYVGRDRRIAKAEQELAAAGI